MPRDLHHLYGLHFAVGTALLQRPLRRNVRADLHPEQRLHTPDLLQICHDADLFAADPDIHLRPDLHRSGVFLFKLCLPRRLQVPRL